MGVLLFYRVDYDQSGRLNNVYSDKKGEVITHLKYTCKTDNIQILSRMFTKYTGFLSKQAKSRVKKKVARAVFGLLIEMTIFYWRVKDFLRDPSRKKFNRCWLLICAGPQNYRSGNTDKW